MIFDEYASYTGYDLGEMPVKSSTELLHDPKFIESFKRKRSNKKIMAVYNKLIHKFHNEIEEALSED